MHARYLLLIPAAIIVTGCAASPGTTAAGAVTTVTATVVRTETATVTATPTTVPAATPGEATADAPAGEVTMGASPAPTATTPPAAAVGAPVPFELIPGSGLASGEVTINSAVWAADSPGTGAAEGNPAYTLYPKNDSFLVLDVTVTSVKGNVASDSTFWVATDAAGTEYGKAFSSNFKPNIPYATLTPGQSARGYVVLDVQRGPVTLVWKGTYGTEPVASWDIPA